MLITFQPTTLSQRRRLLPLQLSPPATPSRPRLIASGRPLSPSPLGPGRIMLRFHHCPHLPLPAVCRQPLAAPSPATPKRPIPFLVSGVRVRGPLRLDAFSRAALGEQQQRRHVSYDDDEEDLGEALDRTRQLVECAMFAAVAGLAYFLSNSLAIELMHGVVGLAMGTIWRLETNWIVSIILCSIIRALGACGYVLVSSFLIRENILALITVNIHASLTYILAAAGVNTIPSMDAIYVLFGTLLLLNCGFFLFLLHIMYTIFLTKLGIKPSLRPPRWLDKAI
ncbi:uncharacterized protein LOC133922194 isoform X2 [Phragmites australis]|uniref:uncharacterized protein LOC133922194 isoform X2 n=1 Tax=Phragmites australis TaxID=29695 RepID=UPI002D786F42|nr:uncharacterized protein LOC133922194 isoform X2 [Phragmites australis]